MLPIVMRPVDRPFDSVTLIVATGREEVRRTVLLQSPIDLLEVRMFSSNSPYCLLYNSCDVSLEDLVSDQLIIP